VSSSGFDTLQSGTLDAGASTSFTFTAPAGLPVYFNSLDRSFSPVNVAFTDPNGNTGFSNYYASYNEGPYILTSSGQYTLTFTNVGSSANPYSFNMLSLPDAAMSLSLGATQTVSGTLNALATNVYSFSGA